jgi:GT2 family glycosyltransferase
MTPELSILIISYNTRDLTLRCLESLRQHPADAAVQTLVFDNASDDGSADAIAEQFPEVELIRSRENAGFARGNNLAARRATGTFLLLLNPDTEVRPGCLDAVLDAARQHADRHLIGGRTFFADGSLNATSVYGEPTLWSTFCKGSGLASLARRSRLLNPESLGRWARDTERQVDLVTGCFLLIRRDHWDRLAGFDESYFMYGEDWDLCLRARKLGLGCRICPRAELIHHGGASERVRSDKMVRLFSANAQLFRRHWSPRRSRFGVAMLDLWAWTRMSALRGIKLLRPDATPRYEAWRSVWQRRELWRSA